MLSIPLLFWQDDHRLHDYNVDDKVKDFIKAVNDQVSLC